MGRRRWLVLFFAVLSMAALGAGAASGTAARPQLTASRVVLQPPPPQGGGLAPVMPPGATLSATTRDDGRPLSKPRPDAAATWAAVAGIAAVTLIRRRPTPVIVQPPGTSIRRRGPPADRISMTV